MYRNNTSLTPRRKNILYIHIKQKRQVVDKSIDGPLTNDVQRGEGSNCHINSRGDWGDFIRNRPTRSHMALFMRKNRVSIFLLYEAHCDHSIEIISFYLVKLHNNFTATPKNWGVHWKNIMKHGKYNAVNEAVSLFATDRCSCLPRLKKKTPTSRSTNSRLLASWAPPETAFRPSQH